jgi:exosortase/archaeosortase family protein
LLLYLPGLSLEVASQCSGIRSTLVLLVTSLLAGELFLVTTWRRIVLAGLVYPLGLLRNGLRIVTIGLLTLRVDPGAIHGPVHRRGGPFFFAASLVPLFIMLFVLKRSERGRGSPWSRGLTEGDSLCEESSERMSA